MPIYLEMPNLNPDFRFKFLKNTGDILTTPHWHKEYELLLITRGAVNLGINDKQFHLTAKQIAFFNSGDIHYVVASPDSERFVYQFDLNFFSDVLSVNPDFDLAKIFSQIEQVSTFWPKNIQEKIYAVLLKISAEKDKHESGFEFAIESLLYKLIVIIIRELPRKKHEVTQLSRIKIKQILETLNRVFKFVEDNYTQKIQLEDAAKISNFSEYYFARFFKKNVGQTFFEFLNDYRLDKAKWILINTNLSITEILIRTGFVSDKTFYRLFKKRIGRTPKQYRKLYHLSD